MRVTVVGAGAVGGYYAAMLARTGHDVTAIARGAHLEAMRSRGGLVIRRGSESWTAPVRAVATPQQAGEADLVIFAVKTYDNPAALPLIPPLCRDGTSVLTLQNGVDSADEVASVVGRAPVLAGSAYIATALSEPGLIDQTGSHSRIVFGEVFEAGPDATPRVAAIADALAKAGVPVEAVGDARIPIWEKYVYLAPFAGLTGIARSPIGPLWAHEHVRIVFHRACLEVAAVARAERVAIAPDLLDRIRRYVDELPASTRSSLLIDLQAGKRTEVEALHGALIRRAGMLDIDVPVMATFYAGLRHLG